MMKARIAVLVGVSLAAAAFTNLVPREATTRHTEAWMESQIPPKAGEYVMGDGYKMNKEVYDTLQPFGIVSRMYLDRRSQGYDVTLIASDQPRSFHDPRVCFDSQGMSLVEEQAATVHSKSRGDVPVTIVKMKRGAGETYAAYFYHGPKGFTSSPKGLFKQLFFSELLTGKPSEGVFYRFISTNLVAPEQLTTFIADYLDAAKASSKGYF